MEEKSNKVKRKIQSLLKTRKEIEEKEVLDYYYTELLNETSKKIMIT